MTISTFWKSTGVFFIVLFIIFAGLLLVLYSGYSYYPSPLPSDYQSP